MREPVDWPTRDPLAHRAAATPDRTALVDTETDREWSVRDLDATVDRLAARLTAIGPGDTDETEGRVGLLAATSAGFVAAVHAILRTGETVVPLNLQLTDAELSDHLARTAPDVLVCERDTEERAVSLFDGPVASLDRPETEGVSGLRPAKTAETNVEPPAWDRRDEAVVLFTSGTTGRAKGVRLTLGNLVASATASAFRLGVAPGDRWLCCLPTYHMGGLAPILRTALYGTTLVVQPSFDADKTARVLDTSGATGVSLVPTQLHRLLETGWHPPESLSAVLLGGAPASEDLLERALARDVPVYPTYGMTETASQVATATPAQVATDPETVGQPLVFTEVTVVDDSGNPVERGESGEVVVDGPTVTPGYLDAEETATATGEYGLHTGDVGRRDADGLLYILGRVDDTIVTGGENVHPSDVADALRSHPGVADAAVVGLPDEEWGERVAAMVVPGTDRVTVAEVESHARERLASYKVPKTIAFAPELPRTASGTLDREAVAQRLRE
ncbi:MULTISPECIES: o-succinylbenzoate--CoA ligase [Salinibaculum]|uniref:o-succinylbenzoate--CoA ligase n=1 Tax=Salinibaculum TaxID=2732368 RepID=UPI0030D1FEEA